MRAWLFVVYSIISPVYQSLPGYGGLKHTSCGDSTSQIQQFVLSIQRFRSIPLIPASSAHTAYYVFNRCEHSSDTKGAKER